MIGSAHRGEAFGPDRGHRTRPGERNLRDVALDAEEPPRRQPMRYRRSTACASWPPSASATPHKPQAFGYQKHPIGIHAGRSSARSVGQRPGQRCMRLSSHVLVVVFCGLDLGTRRLLNTLVCDQVIRPVTWRHSKMLRVLQQHHSCAMLRCRAGKLATARCCCCRRGAAMTVLVEPFASVYMIEAVSASSWRAGGAASRLTPPTITAWDCFRVRARPLPRLPRRVRGSAKTSLRGRCSAFAHVDGFAAE
jgi:hypothetical protein